MNGFLALADGTIFRGESVAAEGSAAEVLTEAAIAEHYGASVRIVEGAVVLVRR